MKPDFLRLIALAVLLLCSCGDESPNIFHVDIVSYLDEGRDIEMVSLPGGTYAMGSIIDPVFYLQTLGPGGSIDTVFNIERPVHVVSVSPFLISSTEITQEQYRAVIGSNPSCFSGFTDMPVENINWLQAADYCNALSDMMGLSPCYDQEYTCNFNTNGFRLPTEAEWEYAARGGSRLEYSFGDIASALIRYGWYSGNSERGPSAVATKEPNQYGLYDMHGNVREWCHDSFGFYTCGAQVDPVIVEAWALRMTRGGSWASSPRDCRSAKRIPQFRDKQISTLGFRIVRRP